MGVDPKAVMNCVQNRLLVTQRTVNSFLAEYGYHRFDHAFDVALKERGFARFRRELRRHEQQLNDRYPA